MKDISKTLVVHKVPRMAIEQTAIKAMAEKWMCEREAVFIIPSYAGCSVALRYFNGVLKSVITGNNGYNGIDVTDAAISIDNLPLATKGSPSRSVTVWGSITVDEEAYQGLGKELDGMDKYHWEERTSFIASIMINNDVIMMRRLKLSFIPDYCTIGGEGKWYTRNFKVSEKQTCLRDALISAKRAPRRVKSLVLTSDAGKGYQVHITNPRIELLL